MSKAYPVITLCGSTRFRKEYELKQKELTLQGNIVISVGLFGHDGDSEVWENMDEGTQTKTKMMLDDMHKKKIDMSDSIFVINPQGYIGKSTWSEICYAWMLGKHIDFLEYVAEEEIKKTVAEHLQKAEELAWKQIDFIRHSNGYYSVYAHMIANSMTVKVGDKVKIVSGPFSDFDGIITEVYPDKSKLRATVSIFGRETPVELEYKQIQKV